MTITDLYPYMILVGSSILAATAWLLYKYRMHTLRSADLIHLNENLEHDLPDFLRQCWPTLKSSKFTGFTWQLNWFGTALREEYGDNGAALIEKSFEIQDVTLKINLYYQKKSWEQRYFSSAMADHLFLLVRMNLWIKLGTVQGAFDQSAKMAVFLQHDMKNMLQLLSLTTDQLEHPVPGKEEKLIQGLRQALPAVRTRAEHMLKALVNTPSKGLIEQHDISRAFSQTAHMYELPLKISGEASVSIQSESLQSIIDNLIGNYSRQSQKQSQTDIRVTIIKDHKSAIIEIEDQEGDPCLWPERLFEPFWSEHGSGRGIGLYQARQQACAAGGDLLIESDKTHPLKFVLSLPLAM